MLKPYIELRGTGVQLVKLPLQPVPDPQRIRDALAFHGGDCFFKILFEPFIQLIRTGIKPVKVLVLILRQRRTQTVAFDLLARRGGFLFQLPLQIVNHRDLIVVRRRDDMRQELFLLLFQRLLFIIRQRIILEQFLDRNDAFLFRLDALPSFIDIGDPAARCQWLKILFVSQNLLRILFRQLQKPRLPADQHLSRAAEMRLLLLLALQCHGRGGRRYKRSARLAPAHDSSDSHAHFLIPSLC